MSKTVLTPEPEDNTEPHDHRHGERTRGRERPLVADRRACGGGERCDRAQRGSSDGRCGQARVYPKRPAASSGSSVRGLGGAKVRGFGETSSLSTGSSDRYSKLRPHRGARIRFIPPPQSTLKPRDRASRPVKAPDIRASAGSKVAPSANTGQRGRGVFRAAAAGVGHPRPAIGDQQRRNTKPRHAGHLSGDLRHVARHGVRDPRRRRRPSGWR